MTPVVWILAAQMAAPAATGLAVVPVGLGEVAPPVEVAQALGQALTRRALPVLETAEVRRRMLQGGWPTEVDVDEQRRSVDQPVPPGEVTQAVLRLQQVVEALENDPRPSDDKTALLQHARLVLARETYNLGFLTGDRKASEKLQQDMFRQLEAAVRADPYVSMPLETFSPEVRRMLDLARRRVAEAPRGVLEIQCEASDAAVFVDGRDTGHLPGAGRANLPAGRYRVWLERPGCRSRTYHVDLEPRGARLAIELDFDCAARPHQGALHFGPGQRIRNDVAVYLARLLDVETLILVGLTQHDDGEWLYAARYDQAQRRAVRQGAVRVSLEQGADLEHLADFLSAGVQRQPEDLPFDLPFEGVPSLAAVGTATGEGASTSPAAGLGAASPALSPLLAAGAVVGATGVVGLVAGAVGLAMWSNAYGALDHPSPGADLDALYDGAKLGWNLAWGGGIAGVLGLAVGGALIAWALLAPVDAGSTVAPTVTTETP